MGIESKITKYLNENIYDYALMIDGKWGVGKSYTIKKYIEKSSFDKKIIYLSLYKVESLKDLEEKVFAQLFKNDELENGQIKSNNEMFNGFKSFLSETSKEFIKNKVGINIDVGIESFKAFHKTCVNFNNYIFCFDDLERTACDITKLLGFINDLIDIYKCKVILIANENEILNKNEEYKLIKEKVIGRTVKFSSDFTEVKKSILKKMVENQDDYFKKLIEEIELATECNLRTYQYFISVSYKLYENIDKNKILNGYSTKIYKQVYYKIFQNLYNKVLEEREKKEVKEILFKSLDRYLSEEFIDIAQLTSEIEICVERLEVHDIDNGLIDRLKNNLYLYKTDENIEVDLKKILENLDDDLYKVKVFPDVLFAILHAESIGFEKLNVFESAKNKMLKIIRNSKKDTIEKNHIYTDFIYDFIKTIKSYDKEQAEFIEKKFKNAEKEIEKAIDEINTTEENKIKLINLKDINLTEKLNTYLKRKRNGEKTIFDLEEINENLIEVIRKMDCTQIHCFRELFINNIYLKKEQSTECKKIYEFLKEVDTEEFPLVKKYAWKFMLFNIENLTL